MCGLTGFARPVDGDATALEVARQALDGLMDKIERRGRHATGIATLNIDQSRYWWKAASPYAVVRKSAQWQKVVEERITDKTIAVQGHTRHATHQNAHKDDCAHPFEVGNVIGAHNGIITNWREIERDLIAAKVLDAKGPGWDVDSIAAFALLNRYKNPLDALSKLDGYFALTWTKGPHIYMARSESGAMHVAYVRDLKTLFWNSESWNLRDVLKSVGMTEKDFTLTEIDAHTVYKLDPRRFDEKGPFFAAMKAEQPWGSRKITRAEADRLTGSAAVDASRGGYSEVRSLPRHDTTRSGDRGAKTYPDGSAWDPTTGTQTPAGEKVKSGGPRTYSLKDLSDQIDGLYAVLRNVVKRGDIHAERIQQLERENDWLWHTLEEAGLTPDRDAGDEDDTVYSDDTPPIEDTSDQVREAAAQMTLPFAHCKSCGRGSYEGHRLLDTTDGKLIGESCIFPEETPSIIDAQLPTAQGSSTLPVC